MALAPEELTRKKIDALLEAAGGVLQDVATETIENLEVALEQF